MSSELEMLEVDFPSTLQDPTHNPSQSSELYSIAMFSHDLGHHQTSYLVFTANPFAIYLRLDNSFERKYAYSLDMEDAYLEHVAMTKAIEGKGYRYTWDEQKQTFVLDEPQELHEFTIHAWTVQDATEISATQDVAARPKFPFHPDANTPFTPTESVYHEDALLDPHLPTYRATLALFGSLGAVPSYNIAYLHYTASHILFSASSTPGEWSLAVGLHPDKSVLTCAAGSAIIRGQGYRYLRTTDEKFNGEPELEAFEIVAESPELAQEIVEGVTEKTRIAREIWNLRDLKFSDLGKETPSFRGER
ncbi:hypothetical protein BDV96DRAFT_639233 [Lophiotrema nucula]|uniref:Uncharacterized protein n=1 Tax=Lophiotrema nucula TaxID=690887 RepID=A0A6A5ZT32_9PLEO|nr:hypothetical protein BDV96DRAFT_639233 [Lophiotrema nucula]